MNLSCWPLYAQTPGRARLRRRPYRDRGHAHHRRSQEAGEEDVHDEIAEAHRSGRDGPAANVHHDSRPRRRGSGRGADVGDCGDGLRHIAEQAVHDPGEDNVLPLFGAPCRRCSGCPRRRSARPRASTENDGPPAMRHPLLHSDQTERVLGMSPGARARCIRYTGACKSVSHNLLHVALHRTFSTQ